MTDQVVVTGVCRVCGCTDDAEHTLCSSCQEGEARLVLLRLCEACLAGVGGQCNHSGCALCRHTAPDAGPLAYDDPEVQAAEVLALVAAHPLLHRLTHAVEATVLAGPEPELRAALDACYAAGVPRPDEDHCGCEACGRMRVERDALLAKVPELPSAPVAVVEWCPDLTDPDAVAVQVAHVMDLGPGIGVDVCAVPFDPAGMDALTLEVIEGMARRWNGRGLDELLEVHSQGSVTARLLRKSGS